MVRQLVRDEKKKKTYGELCIKCRVNCDSWHMCPKCYYDLITKGTEKQVLMWQGVMMWREGQLQDDL